MPVAETIGAAALVGILVLAVLVGYLISVVKRITGDINTLRQLASTSDQAVVGNLRTELGRLSETVAAAVGDSARVMKEEHAQLADSVELTRSNLLAALKDQHSSLAELASTQQQSTVSRLALNETNVVTALRELHKQQAVADAAAEALAVKTAVETVAGEVRRELGQASEALLSKVSGSIHELHAELGKLPNSIGLVHSELSSALKAQGSELRELAGTLHQSTSSRLAEHETTVISALHELRDVRQAEAGARAEVATAEASYLKPIATIAGQSAEVSAPLEAAPAPSELAAQEQSAAADADAITSWEELPERVRVKWMPRITEMVLPPVSYYTVREDASPRELVAKAKNDPVLCAKILAVANSATQGQIKPVNSLERAAIQLGFNILQIIISAYHMEAIFGRYSGYSMEHFKFVQKWSCGSSVLAYHFALKAGSTDYTMLSTAALIARLGSLLLGMTEVGPDVQYRHIASEKLRRAFEMEQWHVSTPVLSEQIALHWGLPEPLPVLLRQQEKPLHRQLTSSLQDRQLQLICLSSALSAAYISRGGENLLKVLSEPDYAMLRRNTELHGLKQAVSEAWASRTLQREFMTIMEMTG